MLMLPLLLGRIGLDASLCGRTPNNVRSSRRQAQPSPRVCVDCRRVCVLRRQCPDLRATRTIPTPNGSQVAGYFQPPRCWSPTQLTSPPPTIFGSTYLYGVLMISVPAPAGADADAVVAESNPPNAWYGNMLSVATPLRVIIPLSRARQTTHCLLLRRARRFLHTARIEALCATTRARARGSRGETAYGGQLIVYTLLLRLLYRKRG